MFPPDTKGFSHHDLSRHEAENSLGMFWRESSLPDLNGKNF